MAERKPAKPRVQKRAAKTIVVVDSSQIAQRAYEIFLQKGAVHGHDLEHWLAAEQELRGH
jgi:hypothetical protein